MGRKPFEPAGRSCVIMLPDKPSLTGVCYDYASDTSKYVVSVDFSTIPREWRSSFVQGGIQPLSAIAELRMVVDKEYVYLIGDTPTFT